MVSKGLALYPRSYDQVWINIFLGLAFVAILSVLINSFDAEGITGL
jgi:hypothetical protein